MMIPFCHATQTSQRLKYARAVWLLRAGEGDMRPARASIVLLLALVCASAAHAQSYPTRPIRLVVPFGAGGGTDNLARIAEPFVSKVLGQPIVIENRSGGGSAIGMDIVAK